MKRMFTFIPFYFDWNSDGYFLIKLFDIETANHDVELFYVERFSGNWRGDFLCLHKLYLWYKDK